MSKTWRDTSCVNQNAFGGRNCFPQQSHLLFLVILYSLLFNTGKPAYCHLMSNRLRLACCCIFSGDISREPIQFHICVLCQVCILWIYERTFLFSNATKISSYKEKIKDRWSWLTINLFIFKISLHVNIPNDIHQWTSIIQVTFSEWQAVEQKVAPWMNLTGIKESVQGSLKDTHPGGDQTMQMYGNFEGFPRNMVHCLGWSCNDPFCRTTTKSEKKMNGKRILVLWLYIHGWDIVAPNGWTNSP